ncbi:MAG: NmrA family NAD(P)-binding protein [Bacteroidota bacterium]
MHIITGASGRVGSAVVANLIKKGEKVRGIIHDEKKAGKLKKLGAEVAVADALNLHALTKAMQGGSTLFAITPETGKTDDVIADTKNILENYHGAVAASGIQKVVGLSSVGAQLGQNSGNLYMSYLLERAFNGLDVQSTFIRPAYYFSNWMMYLPAIKEQGVLASFYPVDMKIAMVSPTDVAQYAADLLTKNDDNSKVYELLGPGYYSTQDVADAFADALGKAVKAQQIPRDEWNKTLKKTGFSPDGIKNFIEMTELVIAGKTDAEAKGATVLKASTTLQQYINEALRMKETV